MTLSKAVFLEHGLFLSHLCINKTNDNVYGVSKQKTHTQETQNKNTVKNTTHAKHKQLR